MLCLLQLLLLLLLLLLPLLLLLLPLLLLMLALLLLLSPLLSPPLVRVLLVMPSAVLVPLQVSPTDHGLA